MKAIVRTHGGFGNQVFQILQGRLFARVRGAQVAEIHDMRYAHRFARSRELGRFSASANALDRLISAMRLPKVLKRYAGRTGECLTLFGTTHFDGYFQTRESFASYPAEAIRLEIERLRHELAIPAGPFTGQVLHHFRLGDFFGSEAEVLGHVKGRLEQIEDGATIITNQEAVFANPAIASKMALKRCHLRTTDAMGAEDVVRLMCEYRVIKANESTLTFWAAVLGACEVEFRTKGLVELRDHLAVLAPARRERDAHVAGRG